MLWLLLRKLKHYKIMKKWEAVAYTWVGKMIRFTSVCDLMHFLLQAKITVTVSKTAEAMKVTVVFYLVCLEVSQLVRAASLPYRTLQGVLDTSTVRTGGDILDRPHVLIRALLKTMSIQFSLTCMS